MALTEITVSEGAGRSSFDGAFQDQYLPELWDHVIQEVTLPSLICKPKGIMGGRRTLGAAVGSRPQSTGEARPENWDLPVPTVGTYTNPVLISRNIYNRLRWSGVLEAAARAGKKFAWTTPRAQDVKDGELEMERKFEVMLMLGYYQILGVTDAASSGTDLSFYGRNAKTSAVADVFKHGTFFLRKNMHIAWSTTMAGSPANSSAEGTAARTKIATITGSTADATIDTDLTTDATADDFIFPYASRADTGASEDTASEYYGTNGLRSMLDDGDVYAYVYELQRSNANYDAYDGYHSDNGGSNRPFTDRLLEFTLDQIVETGNGDEPNELLNARATRREVTKEHNGERWFEAVQTESGFGKLAYRYGDRTYKYKSTLQCPPGDIWCLNTEDFGWLTNMKLSSIDDTGERWVANKDSHEINTCFRGNVFNRHPAKSGVLEDISFDVTALTV